MMKIHFFNYVGYIDNYETTFDGKKNKNKIDQPRKKAKFQKEIFHFSSSSSSEEEDKVKPDKNSSSEQSKTIKKLKKENQSLKKELNDFKEALLLNPPNNDSNNDENYFIDEDDEESDFKNLGQIGEGSTSVTYKVIDLQNNKPYCKKVLKYNDGQTTIKDAQNALKEFQVLYKIDHPCICKSYFINTTEPIKIVKDGEAEEATTISIFLEYLDYKLTDFVSSKFCNNTMKTKIVIEIAHAMNFLHKNEMIHRDLKIDNIMLNSILETKLVDFGLVRINECALNEYLFVNDSLTKGIGTFSYMSPEMLNEEDYDNKTDVYSFGVVVHFIFLGSIPKQSLKDKTAGKKIVINKQSSSSKISPFGIELISKCLSPKPSQRPSFEQILDEIRSKSFELADNVDQFVVMKRDKELELINRIKSKK